MKHHLINTTRSLTLRASAMTAYYVCPTTARPSVADSTTEGPPPMPALSGEAAVRHLRQTGLYDSLSAALAAARYEVEEREGGGYEASNPKQNFRIVFITEGVEAHGSSPMGLGWRLGMRLSAYGYGERKTSVTYAGLKAEGERVEYDLRSRDGAGLSEWYVNRADGLEHGFKIPQAPGEKRDGEKLSLWLSLSGDLKARLADEGRAVLLEGRGVGLRYDSLHAYDATGRELPARMRLSEGGVKLEVSDKGAVYPLTIDPKLWVSLRVGELNLEVSDEEVRDEKVAYLASIIVNPTDPDLPEGAVGQFYNLTFTASGGAAPYTFDVNGGSPPTGLTLAADGILSGTPRAMGTFDFVVRARDAEGAYGQRMYTQFIKGVVVVNPTDTDLPEGAVGQFYNLTFTASGGVAPYTFDVNGGSVPTGLTLAANGILAGTPGSPGGMYTFRIQARDALGISGWRDYTLGVRVPLLVTPTNPNLGDAFADQPYSAVFQAQGGIPPYSFTISDGNLPPGFTLATDGTLSGQTPFAGIYTFTVMARDAAAHGERQYTLVVKKPALLGNTK
jgi:hypothetical protein